jgi:hypothetical protein
LRPFALLADVSKVVCRRRLKTGAIFAGLSRSQHITRCASFNAAAVLNKDANATMLLASAANSASNVIFRLGIAVSQTQVAPSQNSDCRPARQHLVNRDFFAGHIYLVWSAKKHCKSQSAKVLVQIRGLPFLLGMQRCNSPHPRLPREEGEKLLCRNCAHGMQFCHF